MHMSKVRKVPRGDPKEKEPFVLESGEARTNGRCVRRLAMVSRASDHDWITAQQVTAQTGDSLVRERIFCPVFCLSIVSSASSGRPAPGGALDSATPPSETAQQLASQSRPSRTPNSGQIIVGVAVPHQPTTSWCPRQEAHPCFPFLWWLFWAGAAGFWGLFACLVSPPRRRDWPPSALICTDSQSDLHLSPAVIRTTKTLNAAGADTGSTPRAASPAPSSSEQRQGVEQRHPLHSQIALSV